jgi:hypothetical protein
LRALRWRPLRGEHGTLRCDEQKGEAVLVELRGSDDLWGVFLRSLMVMLADAGCVGGERRRKASTRRSARKAGAGVGAAVWGGGATCNTDLKVRLPI